MRQGCQARRIRASQDNFSFSKEVEFSRFRWPKHKWADFQSALMTAVEATWQEEHGTWKLTGGVDRDGEPLTVPIVVLIDTEDVYVWTGF
jgi:hypothetical protein